MTTNNQLICPACGSTELSLAREHRKERAPFGPQVQYNAAFYECSLCGEAGDFSNRNDEPAIQARRDSASQSLVPMLNALSKQGLTNAYIERALELPSRTLSRWKTGELAASSVALLRLVRTFPWLLRVAESNYDERSARSAILAAASEVLAEFASPILKHSNVYIRAEVTIHSSGNFEPKQEESSSGQRPELRCENAGTLNLCETNHD